MTCKFIKMSNGHKVYWKNYLMFVFKWHFKRYSISFIRWRLYVQVYHDSSVVRAEDWRKNQLKSLQATDLWILINVSLAIVL